MVNTIDDQSVHGYGDHTDRILKTGRITNRNQVLPDSVLEPS